MMTAIITKPTRKEALAQRLKRYYGKVCAKHSNSVGLRQTSDGACVGCKRAGAAKWAAEHPQRILTRRRQRYAAKPEANRKYYQKNRDVLMARSRAYHANNRGKANAAALQYYYLHKDKRREYQKKWRAEHPSFWKKYAAKMLAATRKRQLEKRNRTPNWLTPLELTAIAEFYAAALWVTQKSGIKHVVDHYYPLQGKTVSGLHVPANLQVIPAALNARKGNKHPDEFRR